jgi:DNA primase
LLFSESFLESIRRRLSLVSIIGESVRLAHKGRSYVGICPFHVEKSPSFTVQEENENHGHYHCFGCGAHGDLFSFVQKKEGLSFVEVVKKLALRAGIPLELKERAPENTSLFQVMEWACTWFQEHLSRCDRAKDYLKSRGITEENILTFRLGWAPKRGLISDALTAGLLHQRLEEVGLTGRSTEETYARPYERFRERLMFPIMNAQGKIVAFGARTLGKEEPKYLNSPETPLFIKGQSVYGRGIAQKEKSSYPLKGCVLWVEGYFDVIALSAYCRAFSPLGTATTAHQLTSLWQRHAHVTVCMDGDEAGKQAALKLALTALPFLKPGLMLSFMQLPQGHDPHSFLMQHAWSSFQQLANQALPLSHYLWNRLFGRPLIPEDKAKAVAQWKEWAQTITDPDVRRAYLALLYSSSRTSFPKESRPMAPSEHLHQKLLLSMLVLNPPLLEKVKEILVAMVFPKPSPWLQIRDLLLLWNGELSEISEALSTYLGENWQEEINAVRCHIPQNQDLEVQEECWLEFFNAYQTQMYQKEEILTLTETLLDMPSHWERLKLLTQL